MVDGIIPHYGKANTLNVCNFKDSIKLQERSAFIQKPMSKHVRLPHSALYLFALGFTVPRIVISMRGMTPPGKARLYGTV